MSAGKYDFLKSLEVFVCVADVGSMTEAARTLGITQSAISHQIKHLESDLKKPLIDRSVRPIRLTTAGVILHKMAIQFVDDAERIRTGIKNIGGNAINGIRISVIGSLAGTLVPGLVMALMDDLHVRNVTVRRGFQSAQANAFVRRETDLLFCSDSMLEVGHLERYALYSEPFILITPRASLKRGTTLQTLVKSLPFIRYTGRFSTGRAIESHLRRLRINCEDVFEFDSSHDVIAMISAGRGWTITAPLQALHGLRPDSRVSVLPLPSPGFRRTIILVARENELGEIPSRIADVAREIFRTQVIPRLHNLAPWLEGQLIVEDAVAL